MITNPSIKVIGCVSVVNYNVISNPGKNYINSPPTKIVFLFPFKTNEMEDRLKLDIETFRGLAASIYIFKLYNNYFFF